MRNGSRRSALTERARLRLSHLLDQIASGEPAPASGSASAAVVAASAALLQKVATRSPKWEGASAAQARADALRLRAEELVEQDSVAYLAYVDAVRSGKDQERARARTVDVPLEIARAAAEVVELAGLLAVHGNRNLHADAVIAAILANAAADSAALLVAVNVENADDPRLGEAAELAERSEAGKDSLR